MVRLAPGGEKPELTRVPVSSSSLNTVLCEPRPKIRATLSRQSRSTQLMEWSQQPCRAPSSCGKWRDDDLRMTGLGGEPPAPPAPRPSFQGSLSWKRLFMTHSSVLIAVDTT